MASDQGKQGGQGNQGRSGSSRRGFAAMDGEQQRRIAQKGGQASARSQKRDEDGQFAGSRDGGSRGGGTRSSSGGGGNRGGNTRGGGSNR